MPTRSKNPWNAFVADYYRNHKNDKSCVSFRDLAVLYRQHKSKKSEKTKEHHHESKTHDSKNHKHEESKAHKHEEKEKKKHNPHVVSIESNCKHCDPSIPEVFTMEPICELDVTENDPIVRYSLNGKEYCALGSNLLQYFDTKLIIDSVGITTRHGGVTAPIGRKRGPVEPYSGLEFSKEDYKWIKSRVKLPRKRRNNKDR